MFHFLLDWYLIVCYFCKFVICMYFAVISVLILIIHSLFCCLFDVMNMYWPLSCNCHFACLNAVVSLLTFPFICFWLYLDVFYLLSEGLDVLWCILTQHFFSLFQDTVVSRQGKQFFISFFLTNVWWLSVHILHAISVLKLVIFLLFACVFDVISLLTLTLHLFVVVSGCIVSVSREAECLMILHWHTFSFVFFRRLPLQD